MVPAILIKPAISIIPAILTISRINLKFFLIIPANLIRENIIYDTKGTVEYYQLNLIISLVVGNSYLFVHGK